MRSLLLVLKQWFKNFEKKFHPHSLQKYLSNTGWLAFEKFIHLFSLLITGLFLARYLGPKNFGILSYCLSFTVIFGAFSPMGINNIVVRECVKNPEQEDLILGSAFVIRLFGALLSFFLINVTSFFLNSRELTLFISILSLGPVFRSYEIIEYFFQANVLLKYSSSAKIAAESLSVLIKIILIIFKAPLIFFIYSFFFDYVLLAFFLVSTYQTKIKRSIAKWTPNLEIIKSILHDAWPLVFSGIAITIYMKIDQVMIKYILGLTQVGIYAVAARVSQACYLIPVIIYTSVFPAILRTKMNNKKLYHQRLEQFYGVMIWSSLFIALPITLFAPFLIRFLFGLKFLNATQTLQIHVWGLLFKSLCIAIEGYLISENLTKLSLQRTLLGMITNVFLNYVLIPRFGINGAAIATVFSYGIIIVALAFHKKTSEQCFLMLKAMNIFRLIKPLLAESKKGEA